MKRRNLHELKQSLQTVLDWIRYCMSECQRQGVFYGHGTDHPWDEALRLVFHVLNLPLDCKPEVLQARLVEEEKEAVFELLQRRIRDRIPLPYLIQEAWFSNYAFYVDERVLIPRSPIAELIESGFSPWIDIHQVHQVLDLCCGSGCIGIATALHWPQLQVDAVDISAESLAVAEENVKRYDLAERVRLIQSDLFEQMAGELYDVILCNPPYVSEMELQQLPHEYHHEPSLALVAPEDGLGIALKVLSQAAHYLTPHGVLFLELGATWPVLVDRFPEVPWTWVEFTRGGDGVLVMRRDELQRYQRLWMTY